MKTKFLAFITVLMLTVTVFSSCGLIYGEVADEGSISVVVRGGDGKDRLYSAALSDIENKSEGAEGVIRHLSERADDPLSLTMIESTYGAYVSAIGDISENTSEGIYVMVYTSVKADSYEGAPTTVYRDITLYQSGVGLSGMSIEDGTVILFAAEKSPF